MNFETFERKVKQSGMQIAGRETIDGHVVVYADGYTKNPPDKFVDGPHYMTAAAVGPSYDDLRGMHRYYYEWLSDAGKVEDKDKRVTDVRTKIKAFIKDGKAYRNQRR